MNPASRSVSVDAPAAAAPLAAQERGDPPCVVTRRDFLLTSAAATGSFTLMVALPGNAEEIPAQVATYPRQFVTKLSSLRQDEPFGFNYPDDKLHSASFVVKLGRDAGGGIGPVRDVVAYSYSCTHQGGPMQGTYKPEDKVLGPCPLHLTAYDLTRHGIVSAGNAYQSLPQVLLELDGDDIYAVGVFGLIYGRYDNLKA